MPQRDGDPRPTSVPSIRNDSGTGMDPLQLQGLRRGDRVVLLTLYQQHLPRVKRFLRTGFRYSSNGSRIIVHGLRRDEIEDATQEVFARAFSSKNRTAFDGQRPFAAYLLGIARNYRIDLSRARTTMARWLRVCHHAGSHAADQERRVAAAELIATLQHFFLDLSPFEQAVFDCTVCLRETHAQTAAQLGCHRLKVLRTAKKIIRRLKEILETHNHLE